MAIENKTPWVLFSCTEPKDAKGQLVQITTPMHMEFVAPMIRELQAIGQDPTDEDAIFDWEKYKSFLIDPKNDISNDFCALITLISVYVLYGKTSAGATNGPKTAMEFLPRNDFVT